MAVHTVSITYLKLTVPLSHGLRGTRVIKARVITKAKTCYRMPSVWTSHAIIQDSLNGNVIQRFSIYNNYSHSSSLSKTKSTLDTVGYKIQSSKTERLITNWEY